MFCLLAETAVTVRMREQPERICREVFARSDTDYSMNDWSPTAETEKFFPQLRSITVCVERNRREMNTVCSVHVCVCALGPSQLGVYLF